MRALTVKQPWAWAVVWGAGGHVKDVENRSQNFTGAIRGTIAIHAGKQWDHAGACDPEVGRLALAACQENDHWYPRNPPAWLHEQQRSGIAPDMLPTLPFGSIVGAVDLTAVHHATDCNTECSPWAQPDRWHLQLTNPRPLPEPIPTRGFLGLWPLDSATEYRVRTQLEQETH